MSSPLPPKPLHDMSFYHLGANQVPHVHLSQSHIWQYNSVYRLQRSLALSEGALPTLSAVPTLLLVPQKHDPYKVFLIKVTKQTSNV